MRHIDRRARLLCADAPQVPWIVLTDEPEDFADLPVHAVRHVPTGPMAVDYLAHFPRPEKDAVPQPITTSGSRSLPRSKNSTPQFTWMPTRASLSFPRHPSSRALWQCFLVVRKSVAEHLATCGSWRLPVFEELARHLTGDVEILRQARWCHETLLAVTRGKFTSEFFEAWSMGADFLQARGVYSGEGGVIGVAAAHVGWNVDYDTLKNSPIQFCTKVGDRKRHEWFRLKQQSSAIAESTRALRPATHHIPLSPLQAI